MIEACRRAGLKPEQDHRTVIIHSPFMAPGQLEQDVELGLHPSFFRVHAIFFGDVHLANLGPERAGRVSPMASAMALGLLGGRAGAAAVRWHRRVAVQQS